MPVRLIATDLDGTLLDGDLAVTTRTRAALDAARTAGITVVPVTARQPIGLAQIATAAGFTGWALCGNGARAYHLTSQETLFEAYLSVAAQQGLAEALLELAPDALFVSVRQGGEEFVAQQGYADLAEFNDHKREPGTMAPATLAEVLAEPSLKLVVRHPGIDNDQLVATIRGLGLPGFEVTHSGAPFVEVLAEGVTKAWGLARLCTHLSVEPAEVLAFGDAPNDAEMLAWAGRGVAVANAAPHTLAAADEITAAHTDEGVAQTIERLLADASPQPRVTPRRS
ncbi:HAD family hydrolase [Ruania halotolerans]|uniref:HAD family hydrolase n=1 Tax=Ruania halotolerans TaxID=2897773 RepID=UPI001E40CBE9|nr:HAD family hydrolase [Ruania halotolerans]UFU06669.1 Cof-type HAD-IIB family hydrolase [Ruania halotolerans]